MTLSSRASADGCRFCDSCLRVSQLSLVWKDRSQHHKANAGKDTNIQRMLEGIVFRTTGWKRDSWTTDLKHNIKQLLIIQIPRNSIGNFIHFHSVIIVSCGLYVCKIAYSGQNWIKILLPAKFDYPNCIIYITELLSEPSWYRKWINAILFGGTNSAVVYQAVS